MYFAIIVHIAVDGLSKSLVIIYYHYYSIQTGANVDLHQINVLCSRFYLFLQQVQICMYACMCEFFLMSEVS